MKVSANTAKVLKYLEKRETSNVNVTFFQHLQKSTVMKNNKTHQNGLMRQNEIFMVRR